MTMAAGIQRFADHCFYNNNNNSSILKEYEIITLTYNAKACRLDLLCFCACKEPEYNCQCDPTRQYEG